MTTTLQLGAAGLTLKYLPAARAVNPNADGANEAAPSAKSPPAKWLGLHAMLYSSEQAAALIAELPQLAALGVNVLIVEVNYHFAYESHPELRASRVVTREAAGQLARGCKDHGIRLIPQFQCVGHQSWEAQTMPLLVQHPQFDETPGQYPSNEGIYCRSWCPRHPEVNSMIFALLDELIEAFDADGFHVGMDEVFLIASEHCPRCRGGDPSQIFAAAVMDYHKHLVEHHKIEMFMWGDRLLDGDATGYGEWEASTNDTHRAADMIAKDIIICDWHYEVRDSYPSIALLLDKGFRVWPAGWHKLDAVDAFIAEALRHNGPRMLGYLCTTWGKSRPGKLAAFPGLRHAADHMPSLQSKGAK